MLLQLNSPPTGPSEGPLHGFGLLIEPEPWIRIFLRNLADLVRPGPPPAEVSSIPGEYWADAQVQRPVAWKCLQLSLVAHVLALAGAIGASWLLEHQPIVLTDAAAKTNTIIH